MKSTIEIIHDETQLREDTKSKIAEFSRSFHMMESEPKKLISSLKRIFFREDGYLRKMIADFTGSKNGLCSFYLAAPDAERELICRNVFSDSGIFPADSIDKTEKKTKECLLSAMDRILLFAVLTMNEITAEQFLQLGKTELRIIIDRAFPSPVIKPGFYGTSGSEDTVHYVTLRGYGHVSSDEFKKLKPELKKLIYQYLADVYHSGEDSGYAYELMTNIFSPYVTSRISCYASNLIGKYFDDMYDSCMLTIYEKFPRVDLNKGLPTTYLEREIQNTLSEFTSRHIYELKKQQGLEVKKVKDVLAQHEKNNQSCSDLQIAAQTGLSIQKVRTALENISFQQNRIHLNQDVDNEETDIEDTFLKKPEQLAIENERNEIVQKALLKLPETDCHLFCMRYYYDEPVRKEYIRDLDRICHSPLLSMFEQQHAKSSLLSAYKTISEMIAFTRCSFQYALNNLDKLDTKGNPLPAEQAEKMRQGRKIFCMYMGLDNIDNAHSVLPRTKDGKTKDINVQDRQSYKDISAKTGISQNELKLRISQAEYLFSHDQDIMHLFPKGLHSCDDVTGFHFLSESTNRSVEADVESDIFLTDESTDDFEWGGDCSISFTDWD